MTFLDLDAQNPGFFNDGWNWLEKTKNPLVIEAEDMALSGEYQREKNQFASGGEVISLRGGDNDDSGSASFDFKGAHGQYNLKITYFDENDGVGQIKLTHNDEELESFKLERQLESPRADEKTKTTLEIKDIELDNGDKLQIEGLEQGTQWTGEHTRIDKVELIPSETSFIFFLFLALFLFLPLVDNS